MLVLRKKQIVIITLCTFLSVFTFMFSTANKDINENKSVKETVSLPISGKTIILDAGHRNSR